MLLEQDDLRRERDAYREALERISEMVPKTPGGYVEIVVGKIARTALENKTIKTVKERE